MNKPTEVNYLESSCESGPRRAESIAPESDDGFGAACSTTSSTNPTASTSDGIEIEQTVERLAAASPADYERMRRNAAKRLCLRLGALDRLVEYEQRRSAGMRADEKVRDESLSEQTTFAIVSDMGVPGNFIVTDKGVFWRNPAERDQKPVRVCATLRVTAQVRDVASDNWGKILEFVDADNVPHKWTMSMAVLFDNASDVCRELVRQGLEIVPGRRARAMLVEYLANCGPKARGRCVHKTGWFQHVFVLPDRTLGTTTEYVLYQSEHTGTHYAQAGTLDEWKLHVGRLCVGNSRLMLSMCAAFAGPLLHLAGHDSGGFHLVGPSSIGKTTLLGVAASVFGGASYIQTWRSTGNGLEGLCELHNDTLLVLDEMAEVDPKEAGSIAYMIGNGAGKIRSDRNGDARTKKTWRLMLLSSGEVSLAQHMTEGGKVVRAGQEVRLIDLSADTGSGHGVFENLHGFENGGALSNALRHATRQYHGVAGVAFIEAVSSAFTSVQLRLKTVIVSFVKTFLPRDAGGQATRVCNRFAMIAAAGEIATWFNVTGWECGMATEAAAACFHAWLDQRGGASNSERAKILSTVRAFFEKHGDARFSELTPSNDRVTSNRAGFRKGGEGGEEFYVLPGAYKSDVCMGFDPRTVTKVLIEAGWLQPGRDKKSAQKKTLPGLGETRVYVITAAMWRMGSSNDSIAML